MHGKKPVSKGGKPKRSVVGKPAARRAETRKVAAVSHKPTAAAAKNAKTSVTTHAERNAAPAANHAVRAESALERIRPGTVLADSAANETLNDVVHAAAHDASTND